MKKLWKNVIKSFDMGWENLCLINKILVFTFLLLPVGIEGIITIIESIKWLIGKI